MSASYLFISLSAVMLAFIAGWIARVKFDKLIHSGFREFQAMMVARAIDALLVLNGLKMIDDNKLIPHSYDQTRIVQAREFLEKHHARSSNNHEKQ
jgi:hypothetical protein